jgi:VanZ family protein
MISFLFKVKQPVRFLLVVLYIGCIAALSLLPPQDFPKVPFFHGFDKVVHISMYFVFSLLLCWAVRMELNFSWLFLIIPVTFGWGIFMEIMQRSMHLGRSFDPNDILANTLGVVTGVLVYVLATEKSRK